MVFGYMRQNKNYYLQFRTLAFFHNYKIKFSHDDYNTLLVPQEGSKFENEDTIVIVCV